MDLLLNKTSPYARLVLTVAHELGLAARIRCVWVDPWTETARLAELNPLAKIPALVTPAGTCLVESDCIVQYLLALADDRRLVPGDGELRAQMLHRQGLAKGMIDCAFGVTIRRRFGDPEDSFLTQRWLDALPRAVAALETATRARAPGLDPDLDPDLGDVTTAVALSYCDLRMPTLAWRAQAPALAALVDRLAQRPSLVATAPA